MGIRILVGKESFFCAFSGIMILGVLNNMITLFGVSLFLTGFVKGVVIILAILLQNQHGGIIMKK